MKTQVSANFKKYAKKTVVSIFIFMVSYIALLLIAIGFAVSIAAIGFWFLTELPSFLSIILFLGLCATGLSILYFLVKFIFATTKVDTSHLTEITEDQEPKLFALIQEIVTEVDTKFPKKIFLSHDVNASVFYDSSFWSMFLPIRKNLQIGIGLINAVNQQELKAILAHEFGHFSQKSMKVGSYVYNVNEIIYNMLFKNEDLANMYDKMGSVSGYASMFIGISVFIIRKIQKILEYLYNYVNINYMALSREMEFHADEIAAQVAGSQALVDSLLRLNFANYAFNCVLNFYDDKIDDNLKSSNLYTDHRFVMNYIASRSGYPIVNELPMIDKSSLNRYTRTKININQQWASHPSEEDRINALQKLNIIKTDRNTKPAFLLLSNNATIASLFSDILFANITYKEIPTPMDTLHFQKAFSEKQDKNSYDPFFKDIFSVNNPLMESIPTHLEVDESLTHEELFSLENVEKTYDLFGLKNDKKLIEAINKGSVAVKTFDYDGVKRNKDDIPQLLTQIEQEIEVKSKEVMTNNKKIYKHFLNLAKKQGTAHIFEQTYNDYIAFDKINDDLKALAEEVLEKAAFIYETTSYEEITEKLNEIKPLEEVIKKDLHIFLLEENLEISKKNRTTLNEYISKEHIYFSQNQYNNEALELFFTSVNLYIELINEMYFLKKKTFLQSMIIPPVSTL